MGLTRPRFQQIKGTDFKNSCRVAATTNISLAGGAPATVDGVNLQVGDRVLVTAQTTASQNGIYVVATLGSGENGTWVRANDAKHDADVTSGLSVPVTEGSVNDNTTWKLVTDDPITLGSTNLEFQKLYLTDVNSYGDANVATFLASGFGSNTISTTGNVTAGYFIGDGSQLTGISGGGGGGTPGGSNTQVQFNDLGSFGGTAGFTFDKTSNAVSITGKVTAQDFVGPAVEISSNTLASSGTLYVLADTLTLTLPASPATGDSVSVSNRSNQTDCVIDRNGSNIMGEGENLQINQINAAFTLTYINQNQGWILT